MRPSRLFFNTTLAQRCFDPLKLAAELLCRPHAVGSATKSVPIFLLKETLTAAGSTLRQINAHQKTKIAPTGRNIEYSRMQFEQIQSILQGINKNTTPDDFDIEQRKIMAQAHIAIVDFLYKTSGMTEFSIMHDHIERALLLDPDNKLALDYKYEFSINYEPPSQK
jgi:hypothetical protein